MNIQKNIIVEGKSKLPFLMDIFFVNNGISKPIVIFAHGFKGFKDWGHWDLIAEQFAHAGFVFVKFNFSHNGTTLEQPLDFANLEAFGQNNYSKELKDLEAVLNQLSSTLIPSNEVNLNKIALIGHSRGGGISIIKAANDARIKALVTWASVSSLAYSWENNPQMVESWQSEGVFYIKNGRTKQEMPLYFQLFEDYQQNEEAYTLKNALNKLNMPMLILHGSDDPAVPVFATDQLKDAYQQAEIKIIAGANHVFGGSHPYQKEKLPDHSLELVNSSIDFIKKAIC